MKRKEVSTKSLTYALDALTIQLGRKGYGGFASTHEMFGKLMEEVNELSEALHDNDQEQFIAELKDIIVAALFSLASIKSNTHDG
ncbi:MAG TPA: MazG nucleotide pyrophosphohydrolase domain-containing protein [Alphaproteobacteria bacterium]|nr:MazG nucleotide pyrophosphohydrolase domain-containing protein [Alphaproteobacteria bacterium]